MKNDIFNDLTYFTKYQIIGDDRPDNVAFDVYEDETLDWVVLLSNNITNIQTEWPLDHQSYYNFLIDKYGSEEEIHAIHHYETQQVRDTNRTIIVPKGLKVRRLHKAFLRYHDANNWPLLRNALKRMGRADLIGNGKRHLVPSYQPLGTGDRSEVRRGAQKGKPFRTTHTRSEHADTQRNLGSGRKPKPRQSTMRSTNKRRRT